MKKKKKENPCKLCKIDCTGCIHRKKGDNMMKAELKGVDRLYKAVQNFVEKNGGKVLVIGGIEVQQWPEDFSLTYRIAVKCTGKPPKINKY